MSPAAQPAPERRRILGELLELTPAPAEEPLDLQMLRERLARREALLRQLPAGGAAAPDDPCSELLDQLRRRDSAIIAALTEAKARLGRLLRRTADGRQQIGQLVRRTL